ncbi:MAG: hypothetical protein K0B11_13625 [Mariniphaga sp.]|nr:hypothetical protein [Mariniphaga sp.]
MKSERKNKKLAIKKSYNPQWLKIRKVIFVIFLSGLFSGNTNLFGQVAGNDSLPQSAGAPYVYIDCRCDFDHIRTEITFVNYVRDPQLADIHVFVTSERTAGGGREYQFSFIGRREFAGTQYTLKLYIDYNATSGESRNQLTEFLKLGLAGFVLQTPLAKRFKIEYNGNGKEELQQDVHDPWDFWVFQAYLGSIELDLESNKSEFDSRWGFFADRVTEKWKFRIRPYFNLDRVKIETADRDEPVISKQHRHGLDSYAIKSISDHWSAGIFGTYYTYSGRNIKHQIIGSPGIEYSIFPYQVSTRKSIKFTYMVGYGYHQYYEETIYEKTKENLFNHQFEGIVNIQQPWGSIEMGLEGSQYLHDLKRRRIEFFGQTSVRLFEGLSLQFQAVYDVVRDQLSLPKGEATLEEILLRQRELATDYNFSTSIAISYTFGSRFTNIVNTRF